VDGYYSAALLARICAFAEALCPGAESTSIVRDGDAPLDAFEVEIFTARNHFTLTSCGGIVRLFVQLLDSVAECPVLLVEVEAVSEHSADTLRTGARRAEKTTPSTIRSPRQGASAVLRGADVTMQTCRQPAESIHQVIRVSISNLVDEALQLASYL
jgi:hypothetical protein